MIDSKMAVMWPCPKEFRFSIYYLWTGSSISSQIFVAWPAAAVAVLNLPTKSAMTTFSVDSYKYFVSRKLTHMWSYCGGFYLKLFNLIFSGPRLRFFSTRWAIFFAVQKMKGFPQNNLADGKNLLNRTGRETNIKYHPSKGKYIKLPLCQQLYILNREKKI